jgi:hypothetical protein
MGPQDSREQLLEDVLTEVNANLDRMSADDRSRAVKAIHSIAESVRSRQAQSGDR